MPSAAGTIEANLADVDRRIDALEQRVRSPATTVDDVLEPAIRAVTDAMRAALAGAGKADVGDADILDAWQALVKGEPTWNAIRDNCRELVYYRNCLAAGRRDALPAAAERMAVRTARHVLLYIRTRASREGWGTDG
jgi:hypothetical protein